MTNDQFRPEPVSPTFKRLHLRLTVFDNSYICSKYQWCIITQKALAYEHQRCWDK
jgi:hypothetical protein